jgi:hypothetical protein
MSHNSASDTFQKEPISGHTAMIPSLFRKSYLLMVDIPAEYFDLLAASYQPNSPSAVAAAGVLLGQPGPFLCSLAVLASPQGAFPPEVVVPSAAVLRRARVSFVREQPPEFVERAIPLCHAILARPDSAGSGDAQLVLQKLAFLCEQRPGGAPEWDPRPLLEFAIPAAESGDSRQVSCAASVVCAVLGWYGLADGPARTALLALARALRDRWTGFAALTDPAAAPAVCAVTDLFHCAFRGKPGERYFGGFADFGWLDGFVRLLDALLALDPPAACQDDSVRRSFGVVFRSAAHLLEAPWVAEAPSFRTAVLSVIRLVPRSIDFFPTDLYRSNVYWLVRFLGAALPAVVQIVQESPETEAGLVVALTRACQQPPALANDFTENPALYYCDALACEHGLRHLALAVLGRFLGLCPRAPAILRAVVEAMPRDEQSMVVMAEFIKWALATGGIAPDAEEWFRAQVAAYPPQPDDQRYELMRYLLMAHALQLLPNEAVPAVAELLAGSGLLGAGAGPLAFTVGCRLLVALFEHGCLFPPDAVFPLMQHPAECFSPDLVLALGKAAAAAGTPTAVAEAIDFVMGRILQLPEPILLDDPPALRGLAYEIEVCFEVLAELYRLRGAPDAYGFCSLWRECLHMPYYRDIQGNGFMCAAASAIMASEVPGALEVLALVTKLLAQPSVRSHTDTVLLPKRWEGVWFGATFDVAIADLAQVVIVGIWACADQIDEWPGRPELVMAVMEHLTGAFGPNEHGLYEDTDRYVFGRIVAQMIALGWLSRGHKFKAFEYACAVLAEIDPVGEPTGFDGALNIVAAMGVANPEACVFAEVPDFVARCVALMRAGGLFDDHARWVMAQVLGALADVDEDAVRELRTELDKTRDVTPTDNIDPRLGLLAQFVGWRKFQEGRVI